MTEYQPSGLRTWSPLWTIVEKRGFHLIFFPFSPSTKLFALYCLLAPVCSPVWMTPVFSTWNPRWEGAMITQNSNQTDYPQSHGILVSLNYSEICCILDKMCDSTVNRPYIDPWALSYWFCTSIWCVMMVWASPWHSFQIGGKPAARAGFYAGYCRLMCRG